MTTHLRARAAQAGTLLALIVGGVAAVPAAALAAPPGVQITNLSPTVVLAGGQVQLQYTVQNNSGGGGNNSADIKVTGMPCNGDCSQLVPIDPNGNKQFNAKLTAPQVAAGQTQSVTVTISVTIGNDQNSTAKQITVQGPDKPQSVTAIVGKVKDADGKAISGATVAARDSAGTTFAATTDGSGNFSINSSDAKPIAPGGITVAAGKDGFDSATSNVSGVAGKTLKVSLTLKATAASASASPSASASGVPSAPAAALDTNVPSQLAVQPSDGAGTKKASQNSSSGSMLFIVLGALLVAAGIGAIVLVLMRRRNAGGNGGGNDIDPTAMGGGPGVIPPSQGRFNDATRVASAVGAGPATMVAPRSGAPSMADAPTMLQRPVPAAEDEFPDPYGAPLPQPGGGYAGTQAGGWDDEAAGGAYGAPAQYGPPEDDYAGGQYGGGYGGGQYGAAAGAAAAGAAPERFDEHTSLYRPESDQDGYADYGQGGYGGGGQAGGAYGGGAGGAGQYGGAPGGGTYGGGAAGGQYGGAADGGQYGGGAYGSRADEDYRPGGGYQGGGYGQEPAGYGTPAGGIDSGNGYGTQPGAQPGGQYGGGTYGGGGAAPAPAAGSYGGGQYGGGYDEHGGYDQGHEQPGGGYGGGEYGAAPQQYGGGYDQYDEPNNGGYTGGRRGAGGYDDQPPPQPSRRGGPRRPDDY